MLLNCVGGVKAFRGGFYCELLCGFLCLDTYFQFFGRKDCTFVG